ncbi:MlaD family protein [Mycolicibacterium pulveris]|uniref:MlaD family protein n=1 Tax=Mycolicibacterium pulveris TaxID=36813 RepID=UPI003CF0087B
MLLRTTAEHETRILARVGLGLVVIVALVAALIVLNPFRRDEPRTAVTIDTPYVGQGVGDGTPVILHGVRVGEVASVSNRAQGGVRLHLALAPDPATALTDTLAIDFGPSNYFGVTGVNLIRGPAGGQPLRDGAHLDLVPRGNYTMQSFLSRVGELTNGVVTPELISVIDRATRYVHGVEPLLETLLLVASTVTTVQTVSAGQLIRNTAGIAVAAPAFADSVTDLAHRLNDNGIDGDEQFFQDRFLATVQLASTGLFGTVGNLLSSHVRELLPATQVVRTLAAPVPGIARAEGVSETLVELRRRFELMYQGSPQQRALQVHITLDHLPGVAAPLNAIGAPR